jgi:hypothetical protein
MSRYETGIEKAEREAKERDEKKDNAMKWANARATTERIERERFEASRQKDTQYEKYETGFQKAEREEKERVDHWKVAATLINIRVTNELTHLERFEAGCTMSESDRAGMPYVSGQPGWVI